MKNEAHNPEQIGKARALATNEGRLDYLKECCVELDEDMLANVAGGRRTGGKRKKKECSESSDGAHEWEKTGNRKEGRWIGIVDDVEYRCKHCGKVEWKVW